MDASQESEDKEDNSVFIGGKSPMEYVTAVITQAEKYDLVKIRARGRKISMAVDVSQISLNRFLKGWEVKETIIGTHHRPPDNNVRNNFDEKKQSERVSFIEIHLTKK